VNGTNADSSPVAVQVVSTLHALACTPITWSKVDGIASQQQRVVVAVTPMTFEGSLFPTASLREEVVLEGEVELSPAKRVKVEQGDASDHPPSPEQQAQVRAEVKVEQQHDTPQASSASPPGLILIPPQTSSSSPPGIIPPRPHSHPQGSTAPKFESAPPWLGVLHAAQGTAWQWDLATQ